MVKFNRTQKFTKENIGNVSKDKAIVYKIKNAAGDNLYTGIAVEEECKTDCWNIKH